MKLTNLLKTEKLLQVLLVEDCADDAELTLRSLASPNYEIRSARVETEEGFASALRGEPWDIVICDFHMPRFSGLKAIEVLKQLGVDLPLIIVSGTIGEELAVSALKAGAQDYLMKDNLTRLRSAVERELRDFKNRSQLRESEAKLLQAQKMEVVGRLAGGIAHDFNNLLAVILIYCDRILENLEPDHTAYRDVQHIRSAGDNAAALTRQLLAFSRKQVLEPKLLQLDQVIEQMLPMIRSLLTESILLKVNLDSAAAMVEVDPTQIQQVIMNLAVNAKDAMPQGGELTIATSRQEGGSYIRLSVSDTGFGMTPDVRAKIFDPFFTTKGPNKGTGLGLSTVFGIVAQSHGYITVESELDCGATFHVFFPSKTPSEDLSSPSKKSAEQKPAALAQGSGSVLLIEDRENLRELLVQALTKQGYEVVFPKTASEAIALIKGPKNFDLLVTDVVMPEISGFDLAEMMNEKSPDARILFISGYVDSDLEDYGWMDDRSIFLQKPFSVHQFLCKIDEILRS